MRIVSKYRNLSLPVKAAIWFLVVNFFTKGISFITVPVFTRYLSTDEYGKVSVFFTYQNILINFATFEMYSGAYIRGILKYKENIELFTWSEQLLSTIITISAFTFSIPIMSWVISKAQIDFKIYMLMYCYFLLYPAYQCWIGRKRFEYNYKPVVISAVVYSVLSTVVPLVAVMRINATSLVRLFWMLLIEVAFCLPFYLKNLHIGQLVLNRKTVAEQWKFMLLFQAPSIVHALSYVILSSVDRIMIGEMVGNSEAGIYSVATTVASAITILSISANQVLKPWRYQRMEKADFNTIKAKSSFLLIVFGSAIMLWILVAPEIIHFLFREEYHEAIWIIPPVSMSVFFIFLYSMFVDIEEYFFKTIYSMYATTISAVTNIILNYIVINIWGYVACAYTTLICYVLLAVLHLYWANKASINEGIHIKEVFDVEKICLISIFLILAEVVFTLAYNSIVVRYVLVAVLIIICVADFRKIRSSVQEICSS